MSSGVRPGVILAGRWKVTNLYGRGTFCDLYCAKDVLTTGSAIFPPDVAVKCTRSTAADGGATLKWEADILRTLLDCGEDICAPKFLYYFPKLQQPVGNDMPSDSIVMELLRGEDMSKFRNRIRSQCNGSIPTEVACYLILQMLNGIELLHSQGFVHRDIKPSNFVRRSKNSTQFCIIDFGIAKQVRCESICGAMTIIAMYSSAAAKESFD